MASTPPDPLTADQWLDVVAHVPRVWIDPTVRAAEQRILAGLHHNQVSALAFLHPTYTSSV
ncbi:hypothetical protein SAMN04488120_11817 [Fontimonas thermophila]|uniref:Uncharacterized protein n=1 Tax=Fontimonas thermophila TaxID=1076937 RepID=A0A1I2KF63_9GAMM|nr:hypothetical protein [Fontimonas thermophila]SFF65604.1 hypothetical protein SAMN04488120_11817 [Fontimonas thermophila]